MCTPINFLCRSSEEWRTWKKPRRGDTDDDRQNVAGKENVRTRNILLRRSQNHLKNAGMNCSSVFLRSSNSVMERKGGANLLQSDEHKIDLQWSMMTATFVQWEKVAAMKRLFQCPGWPARKREYHQNYDAAGLVSAEKIVDESKRQRLGMYLNDNIISHKIQRASDLGFSPGADQGLCTSENCASLVVTHSRQDILCLRFDSATSDGDSDS